VSWLGNLWIQYPLGCLLGYLIGSIPFGYLVYYGVKGIDIRTVGSGNIGATNVGRNLGFRYFLLVFALDVLKGFVPTIGVPLGLKSLGAFPPYDLPVFVALASVLGHNFPVYLRFKGGKGVATSLGSLLALDPIACAAAAVGFFVVFFLTRYVSLSSIAGALAFVAGHFAQTAQPWNQENRAMSILSITIPVLLLVRHHKNLRRILNGTEPKVSLRRSDRAETPPAKPSGRIHPVLLIGLTAAAAFLLCCGLQVLRNASAPIEVTAGPWTLRETHRELTGQQRSTRVVFADHGRQLAVMCPRYNKVLLYDVTSQAHLDPGSEISLDGRPVAIAMAGDRLVVLQRPAGDDKHLAPGWWESFSLGGKSTGPRVPAGYYPDDLAVTPDGRFLIVLNSGQAEGDKKKPLPGIDVFQAMPDGEAESDSPRPIGHLSLEPEDDADRLFVSASGSRVLVTLPKAKQAVAIDLTDPADPRPAGRTELAQADAPYVSFSPDGDWIIMPTAQASEAVAIQRSASSVDDPSSPPAVGYLVYTRPDDSAVELAQASPVQTLGQFPLKGPLNLGGTRPTGLSFSADRSLLAVATKPGTVHLISIRSRLESETGASKDRIAATAEPRRN